MTSCRTFPIWCRTFWTTPTMDRSSWPTPGCSRNIAPLISSPTFQKDGLLIIVFDESETNDSAHGGGHVAAFIISPKAKQGYQSTALYQHQSTLRLILHGLGIQDLPGCREHCSRNGRVFLRGSSDHSGPVLPSVSVEKFLLCPPATG